MPHSKKVSSSILKCQKLQQLFLIFIYVSEDRGFADVTDPRWCLETTKCQCLVLMNSSASLLFSLFLYFVFPMNLNWTLLCEFNCIPATSIDFSGDPESTQDYFNSNWSTWYNNSYKYWYTNSNLIHLQVADYGYNVTCIHIIPNNWLSEWGILFSHSFYMSNSDLKIHTLLLE